MARPRRRGSSLVLIALIAGAYFGSEWIRTRIDMWRYPWAYADGGRPTLPGTWVGTLATAGGLRSGVVLDLRLRPLSSGGRRRRSLWRSRNATTLTANARMCDTRGEQLLTGAGSAQNKDGSRFHVNLSPADSSRQPDGLALSGIEGGWDGRDALAAQALPFWRERGASVLRSDDPNVKETPFAMTRATDEEYRAICRQLRMTR